MTRKYHLNHSQKAGKSNTASRNAKNLQSNTERDGDKKRSDKKTGLMIGRKGRGEEKTEEWRPTMSNRPFVSANLLG